ncbi:MAG: hypothetical protein U9N53_00820 [Bacteroidota bacterium]|nr:hypothetical protein [Bacteroidota bacterium]
MKRSILPELIAFLLITNILSGCEDTYCPAFPGYLTDYLPYYENSNIEFMNSSENTVKILVSYVHETDSYTIKWNSKCSCAAYAAFKTEMNDNFLLEINGGISVSDNKISIINYTLYDAKRSSDYFEYRVDGIDPFKKENEFLFGDSINLKNDNFYRYNDILVVRGRGLVRFWDETYNCYWELVD